MRKADVEVVIMGKVYTIRSEENPTYLQGVATYLDKKISEVMKNKNFHRMSADFKHLMIHLNVADDYFKAKEWAERLEKDKGRTHDEICKLKQRIVDLEVELSNRLKEIDDLKGESNASS